MVDLHKPADFPIVPGDSLKDDIEPSSAHLGIRYNWTPKNGFDDYRGNLKKSANSYGLSYEQGNSHHEYVGWLSEESDQKSQLTLFYDSSKSAFVLERLAASFDFNLKSSSSLLEDQMKRHARIERPKDVVEVDAVHGEQDDLFHDPDEEAPEDTNPFDYRHYLAEAKENVEKASHHTVGGRTPVPGARTPMSGLSSPLPSATNRFLSTTPQFAPTEIRSSERKAEGLPQSRRKVAISTKSKAMKKAQAPSSKSRTVASLKQPKPLSSETVMDSDDDDSDGVSAHSPAPQTQPPKVKASKTHTRNISSPHITINEGGLEIDEGSPPTELRRRVKVDPDVFRSETGTPSFNRPSTSARDEDIEMHEASDAEEEDENAKYLLPASDEESQDGDVEDLVLDEPEPEPEPEPLPAPRAKRRQSSTTSKKRVGKLQPQAQPQSPPVIDDEEDDGGLAAELEAALEREAQMQAGGGGDEDDEGGVGLGIGINARVEEESDISEEE
ncbi:hypothetical protein H2198_010383 [Neophaeococcomyces mojaviensis]|uniref:Uncharacterized protein n=1 Tax=Neophaeococcomyces mojaviensis TaxID=3383035 RepID=A0ACC2ZRX7_9EURO|nr:hypothetical protein H2198_010383 [Knufia sp. JES_112]